MSVFLDGLKYSVVIPVFNEEASIEPLIVLLAEVLLGSDHEVVFVNDGSTDSTLLHLEKLARVYPWLRILNLSVNSGQGRALEEGLVASRGDIIITMDGDLQNAPYDIIKLLQVINEGFDLVCGWRRQRQDVSIKIIKSKVANYFQRIITGIPLHDMSCSLKAFRRIVAENVKFRRRYDFCFFPLLAALNKKIKIMEVPVKGNPRQYGRTKYNTFPVIMETAYDYFMLVLRSKFRGYF